MDQITLTVAQLEHVIRLAEIAAAQGTPKPAEGLSPAVALPPDMERQALLAGIQGLPVDAQCELMAFMWFGQVRIGENHSRWIELVEAARKEVGKDLPGQLASKVRLHEHLRRGLERVCRVRPGLSPNGAVGS